MHSVGDSVAFCVHALRLSEGGHSRGAAVSNCLFARRACVSRNWLVSAFFFFLMAERASSPLSLSAQVWAVKEVLGAAMSGDARRLRDLLARRKPTPTNLRDAVSRPTRPAARGVPTRPRGLLLSPSSRRHC